MEEVCFDVMPGHKGQGIEGGRGSSIIQTIWPRRLSKTDDWENPG